ncbi:efflux RND transporter permease subunit [Anthocerotibacter panamensis]|uniref:efflux RND transporter permease subunit n=1 Tax=Anthocerotibacter panamensis TaxID=2857077 RepID=UPI001C406774|nr:efflux RND transporter permease subunit [Anthocerotibacter panamensis]
MISFTKTLQGQARAIYLVFALVALGGFLAFRSLPSDVYPELTFPRIAVIAEVGDISPERVVLTVTRPLEEACGQVYRVRWVRSKTIRGSAELSIEFQPGTDMQLALQQLQARVNEVRATLPANINLTIERITPAIFPVLTFNVSTPTLTQADLYTLSRYQIQPRLTRVPGVARVQIQGGDTPQIAVEIDPARLKGYGLGLTQVADALTRTNQVQVVGKLDQHYQQNLVVATGESRSPADLGGTVIATQNGVPVFLRDLGHIQSGHADRSRVVSVDGKPGLTLNIFRQPNSNVVAVSDGVRQELAQIEKSLPPGIQIRPAYNESGLVTDAIANVRDAIGIGIALIFVVLYGFLREWRSTVIAALTIPLSALAAFGVLFLVGQSLNLMSLGGLAVAIGLVIDDAIVVIENIDRQLQGGLSTWAAVTAAASELTGPVVSSTVTTVVVFLPLGLLSGVAGQFFTSLTLTLTAAVIFSLVLALTLTPLLSAQWLKDGGETAEPATLDRLDRAYVRLLKGVLTRPWWVGAVAGVLLVGGGFLFTRLGSDFLPSMDEGSYILDYLTPPGTSLAETDTLAHRLEQLLAQTPEVLAWTRRTGAENGLFATESSRGDILVVLKPASERQRRVQEVIEDQRARIARSLPQLDTDFHQNLQDQLNDLSGNPSPVEVRLFGEDPQVLRTLAAQVEERIQDTPGLVDLVTTGRVGAPQLDVRVDPVRAGRLGLDVAGVESQVQDALLGGIATQVRQADRLIDVRVRLLDQVRRDPAQLAQVPIVSSSGTTLPLSAMATVTPRTGEGEITRENQQRYVSLAANLEGRDLGSVVQDIQQRVKDFTLPAGYTLTVGGLYASQQEAFGQLLVVLGLGILLVYLVLVVQFRSLRQPLAIFTAIPLALFGVVLALWITGTPLNISSFMGIILLVGLVVKNGIILLDYTNQLRATGQPLDAALLEAGRVRLRPILMTTLCTLLGLMPLAIGLGAGAELQKPLAIAVIGGLSLSTVFTLVFVPVVYRLLNRPA